MKKFTIKKGNHFSTPRTFKLLTGPNNKEYQWVVALDDSCVYSFKDLDKGTVAENQWDWNKLVGLSLFDFIPNDKNSIRVGWRYNPTTQKIELGAYMHLDSKIIFSDPITLNIEPNELVRVSIKTYTDKWVVNIISLDSKVEMTYTQTLNKAKHFNFAYENQFYFGGQEVAPHDMHITKLLTKC